jgi:glucuronyl esterase-like protein
MKSSGCLLLCTLAVILTLFEAKPSFYPDKMNLLVYHDEAGKEYPVKTVEDWAKRRAHILANMQEVMGRLPDDSKKVPLDVQVLEEVKEEKYTRKKITFAVEKGDRVPAYLLIPHGLKGKTPGILVPHQTIKIGKMEPAGLGQQPNKHIAKHLAELGYVTLAPDYPKFGDYDIDVYKMGYASATMKGIWNHMRAVDLLQSLPEVDPERIGAIGHSLGGHNSMFVAAFDTRIKCVVSSCGFNSFPKYMKGNLAGWSHNGYMPRIRSQFELKPEKMPFDFTEVVAAIAPRAFLACSPTGDTNFDVDGVRDCIKAATPVYELLGAKETLAATYPDCGHDFPPDVRKVAYAWMERWLK